MKQKNCARNDLMLLFAAENRSSEPTALPLKLIHLSFVGELMDTDNLTIYQGIACFVALKEQFLFFPAPLFLIWINVPIKARRNA